MKRWHQETFHCLKQLKMDIHIGNRSCWKQQLGRYRKKKAFDCGISKCYICHNDKIPKRSKTNQEFISDISFKEQLNESR